MFYKNMLNVKIIKMFWIYNRIANKKIKKVVVLDEKKSIPTEVVALKVSVREGFQHSDPKIMT